MDIKFANDPPIQQIIVYDDSVKRLSSDLKLLELGARTLAFSKAELNIVRMAA